MCPVNEETGGWGCFLQGFGAGVPSSKGVLIHSRLYSLLGDGPDGQPSQGKDTRQLVASEAPFICKAPL